MNISSSRLLKHIDPYHYFREEIPNIKAKSRVKYKYKIAYFIMLKNPQELEAVKTVIEILDDGLSMFLIHVDSKSLSSNVDRAPLEWISTKSNVYRTEKSFKGQWGHASLAFIELYGLYELLDLAEWDFVINLSGTDFPLRKSRDIYNFLKSEGRINHTWVGYERGKQFKFGRMGFLC